MKVNYSFLNSYGDTLKGHFWYAQEHKANVILVTGMQEHSNRYDEFAEFLNKNGYNVYCIDHYGQGENVEDGKYGIVPKKAFYKMADTIYELQLKLEKDEEDIPSFVIAHSMGSFITQAYLQRHRDVALKVILVGTSGRIPFSKFGFFLAKCLINKKNWDKPSPFFTSLSVGAYAKSIKDRQYECEWISYNMENVKKYTADPACNYVCSNGFYYNLLDGTSHLFNKKSIQSINEYCDILVLVGDHDPVSANAKRAKDLVKMYKKYDHYKIELKIYKDMRHEILNEDAKDSVYQDILEFLKK